MLNKIKKILMLILIANIIMIFWGMDSPSQNSLIDVFLRFENEEIYFLNSPILVKIEITNKSVNNYFFEVAENLIFTVDFKVYNSYAEQVPYSKFYILSKATKEKVYTRTMLLTPNQSISYTVDISQWFEFKEGGNYYIQGLFYPSIERDQVFLTKNILKLELNPPKNLFPSEETAKQYVEAKKIQQNLKDIPPYKIVEMALKARIDHNWDLYFTFFDFDSYIIQYSKYKNIYLYASEQERLKIIEDFKKERISEFYNDLIHYEIKKSIIEKDKAIIYAYLEFKYKNIIEKFEGEFYLILKNQVWLISGYILVPIH
ncbi:MAG TPA: hypothetical protein PLF21_02110 [Exilispira sp.]|nr:hypothetical protein [Exilispira sp.]